LSNTNKFGRSDSEFVPPSRILVPTDGSPNAVRALMVAISLAKAFRGEIIILNVIPTPSILLEAPIGLGIPSTGLSQYYNQQEGSANNLVEKALSTCKKQGINNVETQVIRAENSIVEEIIDLAASQKIDLIVIGTRGLGGFKKLLLGSVSSGIVTHAHCNTLVVR
jgi:nucleotide-binding universal stress UspA family protein